MLRQIVTTQRRVRRLFATVDTSGGGTLTRGGNDFTLTRTGTGDVTLTLKNTGQRILFAEASPVADAGALTNTLHSTTDKTRVRLKGWAADNVTAKDGVFYLAMDVSDTADET